MMVRCRCNGTQRFYSSTCPDFATHGVWAELPPFSDPTMRDAAAFHEEWKDRSIGWTPVAMQPKPHPVGETVDFGKHPDAFRRTWPESNAEHVYVPPVAPRVRMVVPPPGKVPANAQRVAQRLSEAGFEVRLTYGVSGEDRFDPDRGVCGVCGKVVGIVAEGGLRSHLPKERVECPGSGSIPEEAKKSKGKCLGCYKEKPLDENGKVKRHDVACNGAEPIETIKGKALPPSESLAVRVKRFGAACWVDGAYEMGGIIEERHIILLGWAEFNAKVSEACERAGGSEYVLPLSAENGKSATADAKNATSNTN
jgi:hypothetical protein